MMGAGEIEMTVHENGVSGATEDKDAFSVRWTLIEELEA